MKFTCEQLLNKFPLPSFLSDFKFSFKHPRKNTQKNDRNLPLRTQRFKKGNVNIT